MKQKQKHKNINRTSFEIQLIKNYYNFNKTIIVKKNKSSFICYGTINVLESKERAFFNNFAIANDITLEINHLSSKSLAPTMLFSSINSIKYIINSGIYQIILYSNKKTNKIRIFTDKLEQYTLLSNKLVQLLNSNLTEEISFNPSIIIDINSNILMRSEKLKKQINTNLNIQLISYFIYLKNKNIFLAK